MNGIAATPSPAAELVAAVVAGRTALEAGLVDEAGDVTPWGETCLDRARVTAQWEVARAAAGEGSLLLAGAAVRSLVALCDWVECWDDVDSLAEWVETEVELDDEAVVALLGLMGR